MRQRKRHTLLRRMRCEFSERARYTVKKTANTQVLAVFLLILSNQKSKVNGHCVLNWAAIFDIINYCEVKI